MKTTFQRKLAVEFLDNIDLVKTKTSKAKKTLRSMISFMNERVNIEYKYAQSLQNLAKTGGVSISHSIIEYKNYEEQTLRDAINALINFTIQESELRKEFALQTKTNIVQMLDETRKNLSLNKKSWMAKLELLKKQIREANEVYKREYLKYQQQQAIVEDSKKKRNEQYLRYGLNIDDQIQYENMPKPIQQAEQRYNDAVAKFNDIKKSTQIQQEYTEKCVAEFNKGSSDILEQIEKQEYQRLEVMKQNLNSFSISIVSLVQQHESLHKLIDQEFLNVDPIKDIQLFIQKNSTFAENERLRNLYKEMGLYQPLMEEMGAQVSDKHKMMIGSGLLVEKTSRAMAQQLKQMEEDRKRKAVEEEQHKKEQQKLNKCQALINQLKDNREFLYKLANSGTNFNTFELLYQPRPGAQGEFKVGSKGTLDQLLFLLICYQKPISTNNLQQKFNISSEQAVYLDKIVQSLQDQPKVSDLFYFLQKLLEYYKQKEISENNKFFTQTMDQKEKEFYRSILGIQWVWIRLIILKHSGYSIEHYEKEMNQFIDQVELEHHQSQQCTVEAIEFTFNAVKYVQKIAKKETFPLSFPLNYLLHQNILALYMDDKHTNDKNLLIPSFQDLFLNLSSFSEKFLGVKNAFQLMHLVKQIFSSHIQASSQPTQSNVNFQEFTDEQNKAMYTIKLLIGKISKEYPSSIRQKLLSIDIIKDKSLHELPQPLDYFNTQVSKEPAKILFRISNAWLLSDVCKGSVEMLTNYHDNFGECHNKLRLILDLASLSFKLSFVFQSDGSFQEKIKNDILIKGGEKMVNEVLESECIEMPWSLQKKSQIAIGKTNILEVVNKFTKFLKKSEPIYKKVWDSHIQSIDQKQPQSSIYYFSQKMSLLIEEDLQNKLDDLDFDKDQYQICGQLLQELQMFDKVSNRKTLNVVKPKLEAWLQLKLFNIREVVSRGIAFETWLPVSESTLNSESVVNVFFTLTETLENLYDFVGQEIFLRWSKCIQVMIHDCLFEYCEALLRGLDNTSQFKPSEVLPALNLNARKGKKTGSFAIAKKNNVVEYTPDMFNQLAGMGSKNWIDFQAVHDQNTSLQKMLTRLANLDFISEHLGHLKVRFFALSHPEVKPFNETQIFATAYEIINDTAQQVIKYIANKMTYIDYNDIIFSNLYIGKGQDLITLRHQLPNLNSYMRTIYLKTPQRYFKQTLLSLHQTLIDGLLRYLMLLTSLGAQLGVECNDFFKNPVILQGDIREISNFFCPKDKDGLDIGLSRQQCDQQSEVVHRFLVYMREDDQMLIGLFKSIDQDVQRNKEMISRVLYRRINKDVEKFFEDYKTLFGK